MMLAGILEAKIAAIGPCVKLEITPGIMRSVWQKASLLQMLLPQYPGSEPDQVYKQKEKIQAEIKHYKNINIPIL